MREVKRARARLRAIAAQMERKQRKLLEVHASLPSPPDEDLARDLDPDADPEPAVEIRNVIACTLHDNLGPLIRDLRTAAEYRPEGRAHAGGGKP